MRVKCEILLSLQVAAIGIISLLIISSINPVLFKNQLLFWALGLIVLFIVSHINYHNWLNYAPAFYAGSLILLFLILFIGDPVRGSVRWIDLGFFRVQPSEAAKAAAILFLSGFYLKNSPKYVKNLFFGFLSVLPAIILVFIQPDIGNTFAFLAIWLGISFVSGMKLKHLIMLVVSALILVTFFIEFLAPYQRGRLESFLDPSKDPLGTGYNIIQSKIAAGSGLILGKGYKQGSQSQLQFLPEAESDFIFASIAEQLGLLGASLVLVLFISFLVRIIKITKGLDKYSQLIVAGTIAYFLAQFTVNVGMNIGLLPVTGITLPFVSYGGSSLITNLFILGIVFSIARTKGSLS